MPTFNYKAKDRAGNTVTGAVDANSPSHAAAVLRERGQLPMDIKQIGGAAAKEAEDGSVFARYLVYPLWTGVNMRALAFFFRQMATLLDSGMTVTESLNSVGRRAGGRLRRIIDEMRESAEHGGGMSVTMARHPRVFSPLQLALMRVGESSGLLSDVMARIASHLEYELSIRRMISKMVAYPVVVLIFALAVHICVPHVKVLIEQGSGPFFALIWPELKLWLAWGPVSVIVIKLLFQFRTVKLAWDTVKVLPPIVGTAARKIAMSRFSRAVALLYAAGVSMAETISVGADACGNYFIAGRIRRAVPPLQNGRSLTESLNSTGVIMPMVMDMLTTGERTGSTDATLEKVADYMDDEVDTTLQKLGIALMVIGLIAAGVVVLLVLVQLYQGYASSAVGAGD